ncbi:MAG TPA: hypothetical protein VET65_08480 [Candidatus Limnocylindrales bacterium]|nr:hypothetical protein [Candidatus Limnocylindrales bacterium]
MPIVVGAVGLSSAPLTAVAAGETVGQAKYVGTTAPASASGGGFADTVRDATAARDIGTPSKVKSALPLPSAQGTGLSSSPGGATSFAGLNHLDQRTAGTGAYANTQFTLEPPDQGLCVGNRYVLESVNDAFAVYSASGTKLSATTALNQFFQRSPAINRVTGVRGDFLSDPKCYYDPVGRRFIQSILEVDAPGALNGSSRSHVLLAVSVTGNPNGAWNLFSIDTSNDGANGTPAHPGCPCLPDQPLLGANRDGIYISVNEFQLTTGNFLFNGAQLYALGRGGLEAAASGSNPAFVHIDVGQVSTGDANLPFWGSIQPSTQPQPSSGTELLMSGGPEDRFQNNALVDNRIAVWSLSGTESLNGDEPALRLSHTVLTTQTYGSNVFDFGATQKPGPTPLRDALGDTDQLSRLNANDSRMNQVTFANGKLYGALNTVITAPGQPDRVGIAYFVVDARADENQNRGGDWNEGQAGLSARVARQGYVAVAGENVLFPSIGVNAGGNGAMVFTLSGPDYYPSAAYVRFGADGPRGPIHITAAGVLPDDGFTGYAAYGGNGIARWGDYSAAVADRDGSIWMAAEWIPGPRTLLANWGTSIAHLSSEGDNQGNN